VVRRIHAGPRTAQTLSPAVTIRRAAIRER